jgi:hypothetical protein
MAVSCHSGQLNRSKLASVHRDLIIFSAGCNSQSKIYNLRSCAGVLAQLVERLNGIAA